jgi:hypothetical protein
MPYDDIKLKTPDAFKNTFLGKSALVISSGHSTEKLLKYKDHIKEKFDVVIVVNYAFQFFDDVMDFHVMVEKISKSSKINNTMPDLLQNGNYRTDVPRIINWKGIDQYDKRYNLHKTGRCNFNGKPNIREYKHNGQAGLLTGPVSSQGFALGSVTLSAMHFAAILGVSDIYLIGAEFIFKDDFDHFYKDRVYRDRQVLLKKSNRHIIVDMEHNGRTYKTTKYFAESAKHIDSIVEKQFNEAGINVFDFSDGLISNVKKLDVDEFFSE